MAQRSDKDPTDGVEVPLAVKIPVVEALRLVQDDGVLQEELPVRAAEVVQKYWIDAVKFHYVNKFQSGNLSDDEREHFIGLHTEAMNNMEGELADIDVMTPSATRKLSAFELGQIVKEVNLFAQSVVDGPPKRPPVV